MNQPPYHQQLLGWLRTLQPDSSVDETTGEEELTALITDAIQRLCLCLQSLRDERSTLSDLLGNDPRAAAFLTDWHDNGDPAVALIRAYGKDQLLGAINDPERLEEIAAANQAFVERLADNRHLEEEYEDNLKESLRQIDEHQQQTGATDDEVDQLLNLLQQITTDNIRGIISPDTIALLVKALHYDNDLLRATREGELHGRNTNIEETLQEECAPQVMPVPQGAASMRQQLPYQHLIDRLQRFNHEEDIWRKGGYR